MNDPIDPQRQLPPQVFKDRQAQRERIATAVLAGFAANPRTDQIFRDYDEIVNLSVKWADELIRQLGEST